MQSGPRASSRGAAAFIDRGRPWCARLLLKRPTPRAWIVRDRNIYIYIYLDTKKWRRQVVSRGCTDLRRERSLTRAGNLVGLLLPYPADHEETTKRTSFRITRPLPRHPARRPASNILCVPVSLAPRLGRVYTWTRAFSKRQQRARPFANCSPNALTIPAAGSPVTLSTLHGFDSRMGMRHGFGGRLPSIPATRGGASIGGRVVARGSQLLPFSPLFLCLFPSSFPSPFLFFSSFFLSFFSSL